MDLLESGLVSSTMTKAMHQIITMKQVDFEIVGLSSLTNGRSCSIHAVDVLRLKETQVNANGELELGDSLCSRLCGGVDAL